MTPRLFRLIGLCIALLHAPHSAAAPADISFAVIAHPMKHAGDEAPLRDAIEQTDAENLAFVVVNGIKKGNEACTDRVYSERKTLLESAGNGLVVSLAASDWAECSGDSGKGAAIGKLNRLRELFFIDEFSLGASKIPVMRQSTIAKFRGFPENSRWEFGGTMFATVNIPANNNHYVYDAGRNSEFEDRLIANRDWINRVFTFAKQDKATAIIFFCDGNPLAPPSPRGPSNRRDGYAEMRKQILALSAKFPGRTLFIHGQASASRRAGTVVWRNNLGELAVAPGWTKITIGKTPGAQLRVDAHTIPETKEHR